MPSEINAGIMQSKYHVQDADSYSIIVQAFERLINQAFAGSHTRFEGMRALGDDGIIFVKLDQPQNT